MKLIFSKSSLLFLIMLSISFYKSQKVTVNGIVKGDVQKDFISVTVAINDTIRKQQNRSSKNENWADYHKLVNSKKFHTFTDLAGKYQIKAKLNDTLYFYKDRYFAQKYKIADIIKKKIKIQLEPEPCVPYVRCEQKVPSNLYIFIGEKVSMNYEADPYYCNVYSLDDGGIKSVYKIKEKIYGDYPKDTIEFKAYDHYGRPMFGYYDTVLLFVSEYCGKLYQEKYQFFDLYKTKDGRWASPGDPYKFDESQEDKTIKPQLIDFDPLIRIETMPPEDEQYPERFQEYKAPYYRLIGNKAFPLMGTYVDDLIKVKLDGVFKERNIKIK